MRSIKYQLNTKRKLRVFALGCHPDDIEFMMGGTLLLLKEAGAEIHYCNLATGSLGSNTMKKDEITRVRQGEARTSAKALEAAFYPSMVEDLEIFYEPAIIKKVAALIREIEPDIMLLPSPDDYMEDHTNTAKIGATAALSRSMGLYETIPPKPPIFESMALYHALPYGLKNAMNIRVYPEFFINITSVIDGKEGLLKLYQSQMDWLDASRQPGSYLNAMRKMALEVGKLSGSFTFAEGWRRHNPLGFSEEDFDPLPALLSACYSAWP